MTLGRSIELPNRKKTLTFIFHDATNSNVGTNKATINSYIARAAHDRRKRSKISQQCQHDTKIRTAGIYRSWKAREDACKMCTISQSLMQPSPLAMLRKGNSDPFNAYAIPITPSVNMILSYSRDYHMPAINKDAVNPGSLDTHRSRRWPYTVGFLQDECTALACLTQTMAAMPPDDLHSHGAFNIEALSFKVKAVRLLRQRLLKSVNDPATHRAMELLMAGAVYSQDFATAKHHAEMLAYLFRSANAPADPLLIWEAVYDDNQRAVMSLARPSFDVDGWVADICAPHFKSLVDSFPIALQVEAAAEGLDLSLDDMMPRSAIIYARHALALFLLVLRDQTWSSPHLFFYMRYLVAVSINKLLHGYMDCLNISETGIHQRWQSSDIEDGHVRIWARVQAYASLAAIAWIRFVAMIDNKHVYRGFSIWKANDMILARTKQLLIETNELFTEVAQAEYARIKLWTLYVGAYFEQVEASQTGEDASDQWYNVKLAEQASAMGLVTWDAMKDVLLGFLYADILEPHGSLWCQMTGN